MKLELHITRKNIKKLLVAVLTAAFKGKACITLENADMVLPRRRATLPLAFFDFPADES